MRSLISGPGAVLTSPGMLPPLQLLEGGRAGRGLGTCCLGAMGVPCASLLFHFFPCWLSDENRTVSALMSRQTSGPQLFPVGMSTSARGLQKPAEYLQWGAFTWGPQTCHSPRGATSAQPGAWVGVKGAPTRQGECLPSLLSPDTGRGARRGSMESRQSLI